jgi:hypothetical protein
MMDSKVARELQNILEGIHDIGTNQQNYWQMTIR